VHLAPKDKVLDFFNSLEKAGYLRFHKEANIQFNPGCIEYGFVKVNEAFMEGKKISGATLTDPIQKDTGGGGDNRGRLQTHKDLPGIIKTREGSGSDSWKLVDWENPISAEEESRFSCKMTTFQSQQSHKQAQICVHTFPDVVSEGIKKNKHWHDCPILSRIWNEGPRNDGSAHYYLEIGANIGSCVMEMLLGTNARIIAFEPHPMNLYNIKKTVLQLDKSFHDRLMLFSVGLGNASGTSTIYSAHDNMGNSGT
jgi:hypothetical protein